MSIPMSTTRAAALAILTACAASPTPPAAHAEARATAATASAKAPSSTSGAIDSVSSHARSIEVVAPGVYVIRHEDAPDTFPQGNTTVVVGARESLAVDSCYLPSSARRDIAQIRAWTDKPVRTLVNTHWHYDHTMGNGAYMDAFPGLAIVAHVETKKQIAGYNPQWFEKFQGRSALFEQRIREGKDRDGKPYTPGELAELRAALAGVGPVWAELRDLAARRDLVPTVAFERELDMDLGDREVRILHLGRGNTAGDAVVLLPREKILVTGDLLDHPVPYLGGGYPVELIATLEAIAALDVDTFVPGHGKVLHGKTYLTQVIAFLRAVVAEVDRQIHRLGNGGRNLEEVRKAVLANVDVAGWRAKFAGGDRENGDFFDDFALAGLVTAAYAELWPR